jgi:hypothetical protein
MQWLTRLANKWVHGMAVPHTTARYAVQQAGWTHQQHDSVPACVMQEIATKLTKFAFHSFMLHLWQKLIQATPTHSRRRQLPKLTN